MYRSLICDVIMVMVTMMMMMMIYISTTLALVGVLAIYLRMMGLTRIVTTDIKDDGEVAENILFNTQQNGTASLL